MKFFENAREGRNHWLLYLALFGVGYVVAQIPTIVYLPILVVRKTMNGEMPTPQNGNFAEAIQSSMAMLNDIPGFVVMMLSFVFWFGAIWLFFKLFHNRERMTLISGDKRFRFGHFFWGMLLYGVLTTAITLIPMLLDPDSYTYTFNGADYFLFLFICIVLVPFQTGCEELVFRGYLMQGFALCTKSKVWALVITSLLFGLMHSINTEVITNGFFKTIPIYILIGASLGFFTIVSDGIEFSWGIHFINNFVAFTLIGSEDGTMNISPLFTLKSDPVTWASYIPVILVPAVIFLLLRKKYGWNIKKAFDNSGLVSIEKPEHP